jgi:hypothetical protein
LNETTSTPRGWFRGPHTGLLLAVVGLALFILGAEPGVFGLDRSPVIGFVQIAVFLVGLGIICLGGYISLSELWNGETKSIPSDIGQRLVATGYVIAVAAGMADLFGFGSQEWPVVPKFGYWQAIGVMIGQAVIGIGFLLLIPFGKPVQPTVNQKGD